MSATRNSEEILGFGVDQIIHVSPPINILQPLFSLVTPDPPPVDVNRERSNCIVNHLKIVKARLMHREAGGLGSFPQSSLTVKGYGEGTIGNLIVGNKKVNSGDNS